MYFVLFYNVDTIILIARPLCLGWYAAFTYKRVADDSVTCVQLHEESALSEIECAMLCSRNKPCGTFIVSANRVHHNGRVTRMCDLRRDCV